MEYKFREFRAVIGLDWRGLFGGGHMHFTRVSLRPRAPSVGTGLLRCVIYRPWFNVNDNVRKETTHECRRGTVDLNMFPVFFESLGKKHENG